MCEALKMVENGRSLREGKSKKKEHSPENGFYSVVTHTTGSVS